MSTNLTWNIFLRGSNVAGQLSCSLHPFPVPANSDQEIPQTLCTMPRLRPVQDCRQHPDGICECYRAPPQASQSMEELDYLRSACAAAQEGNTTRLEEILRKCPEALQDDGHRGSTGYSPLHYAARGGHGAAVDLLLRQGASVNAATSAGRATPLHRASYMGHLHIVEKL